MAFYGKVYKFEKQENYEAFADSYGLPEDKKAFIVNYKPNQKFEKNGDTITQTLNFNDQERTVTFKSGEEFDSNLREVAVKNLYTVDGNKITAVIKLGDKDVVTTIVKVFNDNKLEETTTNNISSVVAKRYYSA